MIDAAFDAPAEADARRVILVDGFNVLHALLENDEHHDGWWRRRQRERLLRRIATWPHHSDEIWVAFDGAEPSWSVWAEPVAKVVSPIAGSGSAGPGPYVHSVFVGNADDWIVRRARRAPRPERVVVVSRDRQVSGRARSAGCAVWSPWELLARCPELPEAASG